MASRFLLLALFALVFSQAIASDPSPLQDFCVADKNSPVFVNGLVCKNPNFTTPEDFFFEGLDQPGNTMNKLGFNANLVNAMALPGLNTLGISLARLDFAPYGLNPPHTHPRATEGDVFVFPEGLIHFQFNIGKTSGFGISGLSSQNPGLITIANAVFKSNPPISDDILAKAFQLDKKIVDWLQTQF
ncbi:germin-like protein 8-2 isoform X2 [Ananas comosus]|uniref:Germin-like protein n=1 Tax=Ananas comosus TaxID=4615 RepID=A0A6P5EZB4_ANACO|nr:germin-like protein 8-2 isoform X2 [Ananas comosus]